MLKLAFVMLSSSHFVVVNHNRRGIGVSCNIVVFYLMHHGRVCIVRRNVRKHTRGFALGVVVGAVAKHIAIVVMATSAVR